MLERCLWTLVAACAASVLGCGASAPTSELEAEETGSVHTALAANRLPGSLSPRASLREAGPARRVLNGKGSGFKTLQAACSMLAPLPCAINDCTDQLESRWHHAAEQDCDDEFLALWACASTEGATCDLQNLVHAPACEPLALALEQCLPTCASSLAQGACSLSCDGKSTFAAHCLEQSGGLSCQCSEGPHAGESFTLQGACGSGAFIEQAAQVCR